MSQLFLGQDSPTRKGSYDGGASSDKSDRSDRSDKSDAPPPQGIIDNGQKNTLAGVFYLYISYLARCCSISLRLSASEGSKCLL